MLKEISVDREKNAQFHFAESKLGWLHEVTLEMNLLPGFYLVADSKWNVIT